MQKEEGERKCPPDRERKKRKQFVCLYLGAKNVLSELALGGWRSK